MNYRSILVLCLTFTSLFAQAQERWFEVELLMFQRNVEVKDIKEQLSSEKIVVNSEQSISLLKPITNSVCVIGEPCLHRKNPVVISNRVFDANGNNFQRLDSSHLQLVKQYEKLEKHTSFDPIFHMAWRMPVKKGTSAKPIHLFAGENLAFNIQKRQLEKAKSASGNFNSTEQLPLLTDKWAIDGNFKIYLDHYLFIDSQLIIRKEVTEAIQQISPNLNSVEVIDEGNGVQIATEDEAVPTSKTEYQTSVKEVLFDQSRRLRSGEVHYLDHPLIGIIIQIRKIPKS